MGLPHRRPSWGDLCGRGRILTRHLQSRVLHSLGRVGGVAGIRGLPSPLWALGMEGCARWRKGLQLAREKCQGMVFTSLRFTGPTGPPKATFHSGKHGGGLPPSLPGTSDQDLPSPAPPTTPSSDSHNDQQPGQPTNPSSLAQGTMGTGYTANHPAQQREDRAVQGRRPPCQGVTCLGAVVPALRAVAGNN